MRIVVSRDEGEDLKEVVDLPPDMAEPAYYHMGVVIGPPDLSAVEGLTKSELKKLNQALVDASLLEWADIKRRRNDLLKAVRNAVGDEKSRGVFMQVYALYQKRWVDAKSS